MAVGSGAALVASIMAVGSGAGAGGSGAALVEVGAGAVGVSSSPQATANTARSANSGMKTNHLGLSNREYGIVLPPYI
jgi:hypothetical protein